MDNVSESEGREPAEESLLSVKKKRILANAVGSIGMGGSIIGGTLAGIAYLGDYISNVGGGVAGFIGGAILSNVFAHAAHKIDSSSEWPEWREPYERGIIKLRRQIISLIEYVVATCNSKNSAARRSFSFA